MAYYQTSKSLDNNIVKLSINTVKPVAVPAKVITDITQSTSEKSDLDPFHAFC